MLNKAAKIVFFLVWTAVFAWLAYPLPEEIWKRVALGIVYFMGLANVKVSAGGLLLGSVFGGALFYLGLIPVLKDALLLGYCVGIISAGAAIAPTSDAKKANDETNTKWHTLFTLIFFSAWAAVFLWIFFPISDVALKRTATVIVFLLGLGTAHYAGYAVLVGSLLGVALFKIELVQVLKDALLLGYFIGAMLAYGLQEASKARAKSGEVKSKIDSLPAKIIFLAAWTALFAWLLLPLPESMWQRIALVLSYALGLASAKIGIYLMFACLLLGVAIFMLDFRPTLKDSLLLGYISGGLAMIVVLVREHTPKISLEERLARQRQRAKEAAEKEAARNLRDAEENRTEQALQQQRRMAEKRDEEAKEKQRQDDQDRRDRDAAYRERERQAYAEREALRELERAQQRQADAEREARNELERLQREKDWWG